MKKMNVLTAYKKWKTYAWTAKEIAGLETGSSLIRTIFRDKLVFYAGYRAALNVEKRRKL